MARTMCLMLFLGDINQAVGNCDLDGTCPEAIKGSALLQHDSSRHTVDVHQLQEELLTDNETSGLESSEPPSVMELFLMRDGPCGDGGRCTDGCKWHYGGDPNSDDCGGACSACTSCLDKFMDTASDKFVSEDVITEKLMEEGFDVATKFLFSMLDGCTTAVDESYVAVVEKLCNLDKPAGFACTACAMNMCYGGECTAKEFGECIVHLNRGLAADFADHLNNMVDDEAKPGDVSALETNWFIRRKAVEAKVDTHVENGCKALGYHSGELKAQCIALWNEHGDSVKGQLAKGIEWAKTRGLTKVKDFAKENPGLIATMIGFR